MNDIEIRFQNQEREFLLSQLREKDQTISDLRQQIKGLREALENIYQSVDKDCLGCKWDASIAKQALSKFTIKGEGG